MADGRLRLWLDGTRTLTYDHILFRTGANATQHFTQFLILPFIGGGSPIEQSFFVDDLRVGTGVLASRPSDSSCLLSAPLAPTR